MQHHVSQQMPSVGVHSAVGTPGVDCYYNILLNNLLEFSLHIDNAFSKVSARAGRRQVGAQGAVARPQRRSSHLAHLAQLLEAGSDAAQVAHPILSHVHLSHVHPILSHVYLPSPTLHPSLCVFSTSCAGAAASGAVTAKHILLS